MTLADRVVEAGQEILTGFAQLLVGQPRLLYQAGFADRNLQPVFDPLHLGPLQRTATPGLAITDQSMEMIPPSPSRPHGGARFTVSWPPEIQSGPVSLGAAVLSFPPKLNVFRIQATFSRPQGPHGEDDAWATVVHARSAGSVELTARDQRITVTLQSAWNAEDALPGQPGVKVNTPLPTLGAGSGPWLPPEVYAMLFPGIAAAPGPIPPPPPPDDPPSAAVFSLELRVDRRPPIGDATLYVRAVSDGYVVDPGPGYLVGYAHHRTFVHPFMAFTATDGTPNVIGAAGVGIAIARGTGPASVTVQDFRIYGLTGWDILNDLVSATWMPDGAVGVMLSVRNRLIDWAFKGATSAAERPR
jgi:hypothetical protein